MPAEAAQQTLAVVAAIPIDTGWGWFWFVFTLLIGLIWLRRHIDVQRGLRDKVLTEADAEGRATGLPPLSMIVAAKDEQDNLPRCIDGLLRQDYPALRLILVNDRSDDRTGQIIDDAARRDARVTGLHVRELRAGWFGKNNAMREGVERADGEWLCFSDADCAFDSPRLLTAAVKFASAQNVDLLSVLPRLEALTFWERVVQPVAGAILVVWFPPRRVNDPRSACAYANGAFMLIRRKTYEAIGGHEPLRTEVNEDMHMARLVKRAGHTLRVVRSEGLYHVRMYVGFSQIWRGWSRIFYGCFGTFPRLLASVLFLSLVSISPYVTLVLSWMGGAAWAHFAGAALFAIVAQQSVLWRFWKLSALSPPWALTYPLGAAVCLGMTLNAMTRLGGFTSTTWRGTTYRGSEHVPASDEHGDGHGDGHGNGHGDEHADGHGHGDGHGDGPRGETSAAQSAAQSAAKM